MAKAIAFIGVPCKDMIYYVGVLLKKLNQKVLVVSFEGEGGEDYQPVYYLGLDWLDCSVEWYINHEDIAQDYSYVIYEYDIRIAIGDSEKDHILELVNDELTNVVYVTDINLINMTEVSQAIELYNRKCRVVIRDICSSRFDKRYYLYKYPWCEDICEIDEIWLDSYNQYYKICVELKEGGKYKRLSNDMILSLQHIVKDLEVFQIGRAHV